MTARTIRAALALLGALALSVGFAGTATAQQVPTCAEATAAVTELEADLASAQAALVTAEGVLTVEQGELDALPRPDEDAVTAAEDAFADADAAFEAELPELLEFSPADYPGDAVPTLASLRVRANLVALLPESGAGSELGAGAQVEVTQAILAYDVRAAALVDLEAAEDAATEAQAAINAQELVVLAAQADVADARALVAEVDEDLAAARAVRAQVCPAPTPTPSDTGTPTPTPSDTVTPSPSQTPTAAPTTPGPSPTSTLFPVQSTSTGGTLPFTGLNVAFATGVAGFCALVGAWLIRRSNRDPAAVDTGE